MVKNDWFIPFARRTNESKIDWILILVSVTWALICSYQLNNNNRGFKSSRGRLFIQFNFSFLSLFYFYLLSVFPVQRGGRGRHHNISRFAHLEPVATASEGDDIFFLISKVSNLSNENWWNGMTRVINIIHSNSVWNLFEIYEFI